MDQNSFDLDFLANETFKLSENISSDMREDSFIFDEIAVKPAPNFFYPERSGIIFKIDRGVNTFCVKGICTTNIKKYFLETAEDEVLKVFGFNDHLEIEEGLHYFPTDTLEVAQVVLDHLGSRRFPIEEDILCNLSDPGFSWWMNIHDKGLQIFFKSHSIGRAQEYTRLGPISDNAIAQVRFSMLEEVLRKFFPVSEFSVGPKGISISSSNIHKDEYQDFLSIFLKGECHLDESKFKDVKKGKTLYLYLKEIAHIRRFWLNLEGLLKN